MKKLVPLVIALLGLGAGVGAGLALKPAPEDAHVADCAPPVEGAEGSEIAEVGGFFGVSNMLPPGMMKLNPNVEMGSQSEYSGDGSVKRNEKLRLRIAATVVQVLPNGHLVIQGDQEVRVNYELRDLQITGIVRPEDISRYNEIPYDRIAGARIAYGGRGQISSVQQPRYGQQVVDRVLPY